MAFEIILIAIALGVGVFLIGIPCYKLIRSMLPTKRDPVAEAKVRLEQAKLEAEAALLNKETEQLYENLYTETLKENNYNNTDRK